MAHVMSRRGFFRTSVAALGGASAAGHALGDVVAGADGFAYEFTQSDAAWLDQLGEHDFSVLRLGATEQPGSSSTWNERRDGEYHCKGCRLKVYTSAWKIQLEKGWAFFRHSVPNSVMTNIDWPRGIEPGQGLDAFSTIEVHCRRCGSHMGHILIVEGDLLHCINGTSLDFIPKGT